MAMAVARVYNGSLRAGLVRGALPLMLKAFSHLDVQWKQQNLLLAVLTVKGALVMTLLIKQYSMLIIGIGMIM